MNEIRIITRRGFLGNVASAGAFVLATPLVSRLEAQGDSEAWKPDLFLSIEPNGATHIVAHRSEMGTGIRTALPTIIADELDADWDRVQIEQGLGDKRLGDQNTDGSRSIVQFYERMREIGASARQMLVAAAAQKWEVPASELKTGKHAVVHPGKDLKIGYGELVALAKTQDVPDKATLTFKKPAEFRYIGKPMAITDLKALCSGKGVFGVDAEMPGMVYAVIERAPVYGAALESHDDSETLKVPGVIRTVVIDPFKPPHHFQALGGVAVIAENTWAAIKGRKALKATWSKSPHASYDSGDYKKELLSTVSKPQKIAREVGNFDRGFGESAQKYEASYYCPHLAHAPMEPPMAVASFANGKVITHAATQNPQAVQQAVSSALGIKEEDVECHVTLIGGGFGRKSKPDYVVEAALLSKETNKPVKVVWTREDDIQFDYFHSVAAMHLKAGLDKDGKTQALLHRSAFPTISSTFAPGAKEGASFEHSMGLTDMPFHIPSHRAENGPAEHHVRIGWLRAVCNVFHAFALHSFMDELAHLTKKDPLDYLLDSLGAPRKLDLASEKAKYANYGQSLDKYPVDTGRLRNVIEKVAELSNWRNAKSVPGRGMGIAAHRSFLAYVAAVATVDVGDNDQITIPRMDIAIDAGKLINPDRVHAQMEGCAVFGASLALYGEITAKNGRIEQSNLDGYRIARMAEAPKEIHVHLVESDEPPAGVGEPGVPPIAPAICNALFAANGKRVRELPIVKQA